VIDRAEEHLGERAAPYLRKFYPWYLERLGLPRRANEPFQRTTTLSEARALVDALPVGIDREAAAVLAA
jgi:hypothetical protein